MDDDDQIDLSPGADRVSSDEETVTANGGDHIADILEEERREDATAAPETDGPLANHFRQLLRDNDDASDTGSAEGLPRRAGSPIDSLLSAQDGSPSVQVCAPSPIGSNAIPGHPG